MTSLPAFIFVLSVAFTATAASGGKKNELVRCDPAVFVKVVEDAVSDVYELYSTVSASCEDVIMGSLECVGNYTDFTDVVSCEADTLTTWVQGMFPAFEQFYIEIIALVEEIIDDIYSCR